MARALGYAKPENAIASHVDDEDKTSTLIQGSGSNYKSKTIIINESGVYSLIMSSKLPQAKVFKKWVTSEVLPSIRKRGAYMTDNFIEQAVADPDFAIRMISEMKDERQKRLAAEEVARAQQVLIEESRPKVEFVDTFVRCQGSVTVGELAKMLRQAGYVKLTVDGEERGMGQNTLFAWMRENHYLGMMGEYYNIPNQQYMAQGLFELKKTTHSEHERLVTSTTTKVTAKGQMYFLNKFKDA